MEKKKSFRNWLTYYQTKYERNPVKKPKIKVLFFVYRDFVSIAFSCFCFLLNVYIEFLLITESHILSCIDRLLGPLGKICGCHRLLYDWNWEVGQRSKFLWPWVTLASNSYVYFIWRTHLFVMLHSFFSCEMSCLLIKQMMYTADVC